MHLGKEGSKSLAFGRRSRADTTVAPYGLRERVEGVHTRSTTWQLHCHQLCLIVSADSMVRFDVRGIQNRLLLAGGKMLTLDIGQVKGRQVSKKSMKILKPPPPTKPWLLQQD